MDLRVAVAIAVALWCAATLTQNIYLHRYLSHQAFALSPAGRFLFRVLFCLLFWARRREWVGVHRLHHRTAGTPLDPHPAEAVGLVRSFVCGERMYQRAAKRESQWSPGTHDIVPDRIDRIHDRVPAGGLLVMTPLLVLIVGASTAIAAVVLFQILLRLTFGGLVSFTHHIGRARLDVPGRDSHLVSILLLGEGYHANHHARPRSPNTAAGIRGIDFSYGVIVLLARLRLAQVND